MTEKNGSEFSGKVPSSKEHPLTGTKKDEPIAGLVPADETNMHLSQAKGWLENDDPYTQNSFRNNLKLIFFVHLILSQPILFSLSELLQDQYGTNTTRPSSDKISEKIKKIQKKILTLGPFQTKIFIIDRISKKR